MRFCKQFKRSRRTVRGGATVEFEFVSLFLLMLTLAVVQYGIIMNTMDTMRQLTREAARFAAVHYTDPTFNSSASTTNSMQWYVAQIAPTAGLKASDVTFPSDYAGSTPTGSGNTIWVHLQYDISKKYITKGLVPGTSGGSHLTDFYATAYIE